MFGHNDKTQDNGNDNQPITDAGHTIEPVNPPVVNDVVAQDDQSWQHPGTPLNDNAHHDEVKPEPSAPTLDKPAHEEHHDNEDMIDDTPIDHDLIDIKQKALGQLSPLIGHLDQPPEERFRTLMMMIQASDDQSLIKDAYEAAQSITDEKVKAQALLDVVNEINYFSSNK